MISAFIRFLGFIGLIRFIGSFGFVVFIGFILAYKVYRV